MREKSVTACWMILVATVYRSVQFFVLIANMLLLLTGLDRNSVNTCVK